MKSCSKLYLDYFIFMFIFTFISLFYNFRILLEKSFPKKKLWKNLRRSIKIKSKLTKIQKLCQIFWKISICKTVMEATAWTLLFLLTNLKGFKNLSKKERFCRHLKISRCLYLLLTNLKGLKNILKNLHENKIVHWDLKGINIVNGHELFWWEQNYCRKKILLMILILQKKDTICWRADVSWFQSWCEIR